MLILFDVVILEELFEFQTTDCVYLLNMLINKKNLDITDDRKEPNFPGVQKIMDFHIYVKIDIMNQGKKLSKQGFYVLNVWNQAVASFLFT